MLISDLALAADLLKEGEVVAFPTETVYGLGASVFLPEAVAKIFKVKGRPQDNPLIVHISDLSQLSLIAQGIPEQFYLLTEAFFPGPLTILLPKNKDVPSIVSANLPTIGVRMPSHPIARELIRTVGVPLVAPSANLSGKPSSTTAQHVLDDFGQAIGGVLDGGVCTIGIESTVMMLEPRPTILRPGHISKEEIAKVLKEPVFLASDTQEKPLSPGMKYRHYAPRAKVRLFESEEAMQLSTHPHCKRMLLRSITQQQLYSLFREADSEGYEEIFILCDEKMRQNSALMNRMKKASLS